MNHFASLLPGHSPTFSAVIRAAQVAAATDVTTLIRGESGTGKELLATAIHRQSSRSEGPMITIDCAGLPEASAELELFGDPEKGYGGRIRAAAGGTLLLDEVGELPLSVQARLLRFLESAELPVAGRDRSEKIDLRVLAATRHDLAEQVAKQLFREDLYYRLNIVPLELPPLRERIEDIPLLLERLSSQMAEQHSVAPPYYNRQAQRLLQQYHWPGNVRELRNFCERTAILLGGREVGLENLPREIRQPQTATCAATFALPEDGIRLDEVEQQLIRQALERTRGNRSRAARLLGLTRDTLLYRLKKYAIQ